MNLHRALALLSALSMAGIGGAAGQSASNPFPPPPGQTASNPPPAGSGGGAQSSPFPPAPGQGGSAGHPAQQQASPSPFGAPGVQAPNPFTAPPAASQGVCEKFPALRAQAEKDASVIKAASDRKATREEVCAAFTRFIRSEGQMVKFLETNQRACGVPAEAVKQVKESHSRTQQIRKQVCSGGPSAPRAPSLSDALGGPILSDEPPKPGRGTFDTLTGSALGR